MTNISFSQYNIWKTCPFQWKLLYIDKLRERSDNIHSIFGTAIHETLQEYLKVIYSEDIKTADSRDWYDFLFNSMSNAYLNAKKLMPDNNITNESEFREYYNDGIKIIDYFKKHRNDFFKKTNHILLGIEFPLQYNIKPNLVFNGYIDVIIKNTLTNKITIFDFKKSYRGWSPKVKNNPMKRAQLQLYKHFYSKMFDVDLENIDIMFLILKQKLYENCDFAQKRIQKVVPPSSNITIKKVYNNFEKFINTCFDDSGNINLDIKYKKQPSNYNCNYCPFKDKPEICNKNNE